MRLTTTPTSLTLLTSILAHLTPLTHAKDGAIVFCNEKDFTGDCTIAYEFDWNKCFWIPDYKAKADKGSSFKVSPAYMLRLFRSLLSFHAVLPSLYCTINHPLNYDLSYLAGRVILPGDIPTSDLPSKTSTTSQSHSNSLLPKHRSSQTPTQPAVSTTAPTVTETVQHHRQPVYLTFGTSINHIRRSCVSGDLMNLRIRVDVGRVGIRRDGEVLERRGVWVVADGAVVELRYLCNGWNDKTVV